MTIDQDGNVVRLNYPGGWTRTLTVGKAAADLPEVRWNNNALVATTVRGEAEVTESWEVTADRSKLIMTTSVSRGDQAHSFKRVYQAEK